VWLVGGQLLVVEALRMPMVEGISKAPEGERQAVYQAAVARHEVFCLERKLCVERLLAEATA
jgi:hypothetical protein